MRLFQVVVLVIAQKRDNLKSVSHVQHAFEIREFKKLRQQLQRKHHIKIELCNYSMLMTLYKIGEVHFRLLGTNGYHVKAKSERFSATSSRCRQNLKCENFTSSFLRLRQNIAAKCVPSYLQHDCFFFIQPIKSLICGVVDVAVIY